MTKQEFQQQVKLANPGGGCTISYAKLVDLLGKPNLDGDSVSDAGWVVLFKGETIAIYNHKDGKNYLGADGLNVEDIKNWRIGGRNRVIAAELTALLESVD